MKTKVLKTIALAAWMTMQAGGANAQSYTEEVYEFQTWSGESGSYSTAIDPETSTNITNTSGKTVYVETAQFYGHDLNGRFAHSTNSISADGGLMSGYASNKNRYFSILNLQIGDVVIVEGASNNTASTLSFTSANASYCSDDGTQTAVTASEALQSGREYVITSGSTFDLYMSSSSNIFRIYKVTIRKLATSISTDLGPEVDYDFKSWYAESCYTSALSEEASVNTAGGTVYKETATYNGHDISSIACNRNFLSASSNGLVISHDGTKTKTLSVFGVKAGDIVSVTLRQNSGNSTVTVNSESTKPTLSISTSAATLSVKVSQDGSFDMGFNLSKVIYIERIRIFTPKAQTMSIGATGYRTFSSTEAVDISGQTDFEAYYASSLEGNVLSMTKIDDGIIPANTAVMLYGTSGTFYYTASEKTIAGNLLQPVLSDAQTVGIDYTGKKTYLLANVGGTIGFAPLSAASTDLGGKAYLLLDKAVEASALTILFDSETTGISNLNSAGLTSNPSPGREGVVFDLQGRQVANGKLQKGLYIVNGRKVYIK